MSGQHERDGFDAETPALPAAGYLPAHDPAVHGHAYAVRVPGQDTRPFAAIRENHPEPCRCDAHKYGQRPGTDAVLYAGKDAVGLLERAAVRDGRILDALAYADERLSLLHAKCEAADAATRRTLAPAIEAWQRWRMAEDAKQVAA